MLYERTTDQNGKVAVDADGLKSAGDKVMALAMVGGPQNQSFLATANVTLNGEDIGEDLSCVLNWFKTGLNLIGPDDPGERLEHLLDEDPDFLSFASAFLKSTSTGVDHLEVVKEAISRDDARVPDALFRWLTESPERLTVRRGGLMFERKDGDHVYQVSVRAAHEHEPGQVVRLELSEESDGTQRLLSLISALHRLRTAGSAYVIDEVDRSLHPILVRELLHFFLQSRVGGPRQIIVTTHESNLLDQDLLRRDEIWFAEKDQTGATRLYSLVNFKVRNDLEIRKHYLQGRFGAVPFLGNLENLPVGTE